MTPFDHDDLSDNEYPAPSAYNHRRYNFNRFLCWADIVSCGWALAIALGVAYIAYLIIADLCNGTMY